MNFWLGALISEKGDDLYRMKGVIAIRDFPETFVFQVSAIQYRLVVPACWAMCDPPMGHA